MRSYSTYDMTEPWDSPNNSKLLDRRPEVYHCPSRHCGPELTSYAMLVGPGTAFPGEKSTKLGDIRDGAANTILMAEMPNFDIPWTQPSDLDVREMSWVINDSSKAAISSPHQRAPLLLFADASIRGYRTYPTPAMLKALVTIDGAEPVSRDSIP